MNFKPLPIVVLLLALAPATPAPEQVSRERMRADLEFLCSPPIEGRVSLSRGADATAWFLASEMRKIGLDPAVDKGFLQRFDVVPVRLDRDRSSIQIVRSSGDQTFAAVSVFFPEPTKPVDLTLDVVFAGYGISAPEFGYDDYAGVDVAGKAVLVFDHEPQENDPKSVFHGAGFTLHANLWSKTRTAERHGAAAVLVVTQPINSHRPPARAPDRANAPQQALAPSELRIPRFGVSPDVAATLLQSTGRTPAEWQTRYRPCAIALVTAAGGSEGTAPRRESGGGSPGVVECGRSVAGNRSGAPGGDHPGDVSLRPSRRSERQTLSRCKRQRVRRGGDARSGAPAGAAAAAAQRPLRRVRLGRAVDARLVLLRREPASSA